MKYFISDLHFCHESLNTQMDCRGFENAEAMNRYMIAQWNSRVREVDEVYILGDFCISYRAAEAEGILKQLRGKKSLITGNHDRFLDDKAFDRSLFEWIGPYKEIRHNKKKLILSHYPVFCYNGQYLRNPDGAPKTYMLYGHVHNTYDEVLVNRFIRETRESMRTILGLSEQAPIPCQMINCFCMFSDYVPLTLEEWTLVDRKRRAGMTTDISSQA